MSAWLVLLCLAAPGVRGDEELERWVRALDAAREPGWSEALDRLLELGSPAEQRVLADFEGVEVAARRSRAKLLLQAPDPARCARVLVLLADPDPEVRGLFAEWLGNLSLAEVAGEERVRALERLARDDADETVRARARDALAESALPQAVAVLDQLLASLPPDEAEEAARDLARLPSARERLIARVLSGFGAPRAGKEPLPDGVLAALMTGYGRALAEVPRGGLEARERQPFLRARRHPSAEVQVAGGVALGSFVARAAELTESDRADEVLARLGAEGWPREECLRRRLDLAWLRRGDPAAGLELARELAHRALALPEEEAHFWEIQALFFQGAAQYALGDLPAAGALFARLIRRLEAARAARTDLFPSTRGYELESAGGAWYVERLHLLALARVWLALVHLSADPLDRRCVEELRASHQVFLEARAVAQRTGVPDPASLDSLFERDLSPHVLVLFNEELAPEGRGAALDRARSLAEAWATVAGSEMLGFSGSPGVEPEAGDPFSDPARLAALQSLRQAEQQATERRLSELRRELQGELAPDKNADALEFLALVLRQRLREIGEAREDEQEALRRAGDPTRLGPEELRRIYVHLAEYLAPSLHVYALANELRVEGRAAEARALSERALATLRNDPGSVSSVWAEWASTRFELLRGATLMDEGRPEEAERSGLEAVKRLEAIEKTLEDWRAGGGNGQDVRTREAQLRMIRELRGDALLSLAVNANVRLGNPARALEYFERAYVLNQNPFMRVLRACYRARSGKSDEARSVLRSVVPAPSLYYNLACTHALLGEKDLALDFLERDFRENYPTPGSLARQRDWARKDPDLASLAGEARFTRLLGGAGR